MGGILQIVTVCFDYPDRPEFGLLHDVFQRSCQRLMPDVDFVSYRPAPPVEDGRNHGYLDNTFKLKIWCEHMDNTDKRVIFIDCDMLALQHARHAFNVDFDIAYTACPVGFKVPLNGGVIMARPTPQARTFFKRLRKINDQMYRHFDFHEPWQKKYHGMNQSAMGCLIETQAEDIMIHKYTTQEFNAIECDWAHIDEKTVFLHINKALRRAIIEKRRPYGSIENAMIKWYKEAI